MVYAHLAPGNRLLYSAQKRSYVRIKRSSRFFVFTNARDHRRLYSLFGGNKNNNGEATNQNPFSNFRDLLKTAQDAQARASVEAQKAQEELSKVEFEGYDSDEMVRVVVTGNQEPKSIELTQNIFDLELDEVEASILAAMKEAHSKSVAGMKSRMQQLYSDLGFPMPPQQ